MKNFNRKIKYALVITVICLIAFIGFSKAGILFSDNGKDVVTVSTSNKTFDPNSYVANVSSILMTEVATTTLETTKETTTITTTKKITTTTTTTKSTTAAYVWSGDVLTKSKGVVTGPSGKETYYNLDMTKIVTAMRRLGFTEEEYPYWVREDGVKMLGNYVMAAANYEIRPKGSIIESSLGYAIVCDTGSFVKTNPTQIDIAVTWK